MLSNSDLRALFLGPDAPPKASAKRLRRDSQPVRRADWQTQLLAAAALERAAQAVGGELNGVSAALRGPGCFDGTPPARRRAVFATAMATAARLAGLVDALLASPLAPSLVADLGRPPSSSSGGE